MLAVCTHRRLLLRDTGRMSLRSDLAANRWLPRLLASVTVMVANLVFEFAADVPRAEGLPPSVGLDALSVFCLVMSVRAGMAQAGARLAAEAAELHTSRAPDAGPDQCPVCGGFGLDALAADDELMERGPDRAKVVAYGPQRAHWDCAEWSPYVPTVEEKAAERHDREHRNGRHDNLCDWCFVEDERWEWAATGRKWGRPWPELLAPATAGGRSIRLSLKPDSGFRFWLIHSGPPSRHMDVLTVESCERAPDGAGWLVGLAESLRHGLFVMQNGTQRMMPLDTDRLWNRETGRPFTRTELGLCDCSPPVTTGRLRASVDPRPFQWRGMDAEVREAGLAPCRPTPAEAEWRAQWRP